MRKRRLRAPLEFPLLSTFTFSRTRSTENSEDGSKLLVRRVQAVFDKPRPTPRNKARTMPFVKVGTFWKARRFEGRFAGKCENFTRLDRNRSVAGTSIWQQRRTVRFMNARKKIWEHLTELISHHRFLFAFVIAMLAVELATALLIVPAFADASPGFGRYGVADTQVGDEPIQLAQAKLPPIGSIDDYMHQSGDGPPTSPASPAYSSRSVPTPGYGYRPQQPLAQEWKNLNSNPNAQRDLLIGAAVVGAIAVGMWAYQQHEQYQARRHFRRRFYGPRPAFPY
jgi:hypothetical protein